MEITDISEDSGPQFSEPLNIRAEYIIKPCISQMKTLRPSEMKNLLRAKSYNTTNLGLKPNEKITKGKKN